MDREQQMLYDMLIESYGLNNAAEAYLEAEYAEQFHTLPPDARFLQHIEAVRSGDDVSYIYVWRERGATL